MDTVYQVELGTRAVRTYEKIRESALKHSRDASHPSVTLLTMLDAVIDTFISQKPFDNLRLAGPFSRIYWVNAGRLRVFFVASPKPLTVVIVCISTTMRSVPTDQRAAAIINKLMASGHVRFATSVVN